MDKQLQLEIYEVLRAGKAFRDFDNEALQDFAASVKLHLMPASANVDPRQCEATERLSVVFKGRLVFVVKGADAEEGHCWPR